MTILVAAMMASIAPASAACKNDLIALESWSIKPDGDQFNELTTVLVSKAAKPIRMIDGKVGFRDALGEIISAFAIDRDTTLPAGEPVTQVGLWGQNTFERLLKLRHDEVQVETCVRAVLYEDGTKEIFN
jgi:hypothetical protein